MQNLLIAVIAGLLLFCEAGAFAADHPWQIDSAEGDSSIVFGFLAQGQAERVRTTTGAGDSQDLFLRRLRIIASGKYKNLSFFIETDSPNLGKGTAAGGKVEEKVFLQDAIFTYTFRPQFQLDGGMLLMAQSHNYCQSAATLLPIDYGPYTFVASDPTGSRMGRDYGVQARGYLFNQHFEYRAGVFQGNRAAAGTTSPGTSNDFRYLGRVVWYPFEAETGFFYTGTTLGTKKILSIGAAFDHQMNYNAQTVDVFFDQPLHHGDGLTLQASYTYLDGGSTFPQLPREHVWLMEAGYYNRHTKLGPFAQLSNRLFADPQTKDLKKYLGGIAYWASGHRFNVKLGVGRSLGSPAAESWQVVLQGQAFVY